MCEAYERQADRINSYCLRMYRQASYSASHRTRRCQTRILPHYALTFNTAHSGQAGCTSRPILKSLKSVTAESTAILLQHIDTCLATSGLRLPLRARHAIRRAITSNASFSRSLALELQKQSSKATVNIGLYDEGQWKDRLRSFHVSSEQWTAIDAVLRLIHDVSTHLG